MEARPVSVYSNQPKTVLLSAKYGDILPIYRQCTNVKKKKNLYIIPHPANVDNMASSYQC